RAIGQNGASAWTGEVAATTLNPPPTAPSGLAAVSTSASRVDLSWRDTSSNETAFAVWRKGPGTDWTRIAVCIPNSTTYADTGLAPLTGYAYRLRAIGSGGASVWSSEASVTTLPLPPATPGGLAVRV